MSATATLLGSSKPTGVSPDHADQPVGRANFPALWIAVAATAGVATDRSFSVPNAFSLAVAAAALVAWLITRPTGRHAWAFLLLAITASAAAYHHFRYFDVPANDIRRFASVEGMPAHLRGRVAAPVLRVAGGDDPMQTIPRPEASKVLVDVEQRLHAGATQTVCGRIVAYVPGKPSEVYPGDEIELIGQLFLPRGPGNPGEFDANQEMRDQGIGAILSVPASPDAIRLVARRWPSSLSGWLGRLHAFCKATLDERLTAEPALAAALLLGDGSGLSRPEWDKFLKSGVVHALAISGQHLVVLAVFLSILRRIAFIRLVPATIGITVILLGYALLTGGRAPAMRAVWMIVVFSLAAIVRRPRSFGSSFAVAWLGIVLVNPADVLQTGCQLSFLAVAILGWMVPRLRAPFLQSDPLADLADAQETRRQRWWRSLRRALWEAYLVNTIIWLGITPLVASRFHIVSPIALLIGPPVVLATSCALASGLLLLVLAPILGPLAAPLAWATDSSLFLCEWIIDWGLSLPAAWFALGDVPLAWLLLFYVGLLVPLVVPRCPIGWFAWATLFWLLIGLVFGLGYARRAEFRVAFLSVGHGGCTVIETSGGRVLVYDAGAISGPDVTRRIIVPYLGSRGLTHIDDLFISHADLDHFSGVPDLLDRIPVRRVTLTPSFADRVTPGVRRVNAELKKRAIPTRTIKAGDGEQVDDVKLDILHPPALGPDGKENARSLVMLVRKESYGILLTGDLEDAGLEKVLSLRPPGVDIMMAPHHGSRLANPAELANWAQPRVVISSQGRPRGLVSPAAVYKAIGAQYLTTFGDGAIGIEWRNGACELSTFRSKQAIRLRPPRVR